MRDGIQQIVPIPGRVSLVPDFDFNIQRIPRPDAWLN
jgi:hypothetical protein